MSRKTSTTKNGNQSFWSTVPGILTAFAAVITSIAGLIAALTAAGIFNNRPQQPIPTSTATVQQSTINAPAQIASSTLSNTTIVITPAGCFGQYFQNVAKDRISSLEVGSDKDIISSDQVTENPIGIQLTDNGNSVGGLIFRFFTDGQLFKVESVVDSNCKVLDNYLNITSGGDKNVLQNWDALQLEFGNNSYELRLGYNGAISARFRKLN